MRFLLVAFAFVLLGSSCRKTKLVIVPPAAPLAAPAGSVPFARGAFITTPGLHAHTGPDQLVILDLTVAGNRLGWLYSLERRPPGGGSSKRNSQASLSLNDPGDPWFVFVETPGNVWFFNGSDQLSYTLGDERGSQSGQAIFNGKLQQAAPRIPDEVVLRLPEALRKELPPVQNPGPRPSI